MNYFIYKLYSDDGILLNTATSFLDASPIYNSVSCDGLSMRVTKSHLGHLNLIPCSRFVDKTFYFFN